MRKSFQTTGNHSLLREMLISILILFLLAMVIMTTLSLDKFKKESMNLYESNIESSSELLLNNILTQLSFIGENAYQFPLDLTLKSLKENLLIQPNNNPVAYIQMDSYVNEKIQQLENLHRNLVQAILYTYDDNIFYSYSHYLQPHLDIDEALASSEILQENAFGTRYNAMENIFTKDVGMVIPLVYTLDPRLNEKVIFLVSVEKLTKLFNSHYMEFFDDITIIAGDTVLHHRGPLNDISIDDLKSTVKQNGKKYYISSTYDKNLQWTIILAKDIGDLSSRMMAFSITLIIIMVILLVIAFFAILHTYSRFRRPFDQLALLMEENGKTLSYAHFSYPGNNEIGVLGQHYNDMIDEIESLFLELKERLDEVEAERTMKEWEQEQKVAAELKALQAQINPHFLYNALNSIVWTAENHNDKEIKEITLKLANFYKTGLSNGEDFITLRKELEHASNYLWIQCRRYDMIRYDFHIEDETLLDKLVPKVILQPLIENAIYHGIKGTGKDGQIDISLRKEDGRIILSVSNNGRPIGKEDMETLNANLQAGIIDSRSGYGIYNVNNRIKLSYGQSWGLHLECDGLTTTAVITLPEEN